jgi:hypothetical protein
MAGNEGCFRSRRREDPQSMKLPVVCTVLQFARRGQAQERDFRATHGVNTRLCMMIQNKRSGHEHRRPPMSILFAQL